MLEYSVVACLATSSGSHKHESVSDLNGVIKLNNLCDEDVNRLEIEVSA
jgi:hypothetical protein